MKIHYILLCFLSFLCLTAVLKPNLAYCQEERQSFLAYTGLFANAGYNFIKYSTWDSAESRQKNINANGYAFGGGAAFQVYANEIVGDFKIAYNQNGGSHVVQHLMFSIYGKYLWKISAEISIGTGFGIYMDTPPATNGYNGAAGLQLPLCFTYSFSNSTKLFADIEFRLGSYGYNVYMGDDESRKINISLSTGFMFAIGRL